MREPRKPVAPVTTIFTVAGSPRPVPIVVRRNDAERRLVPPLLAPGEPGDVGDRDRLRRDVRGPGRASRSARATSST